MADDINNNEGVDEAGDAGMPDDLKRLLAVRELMGSEVGYRREYIEKHAHDARFLDA